MRDVLGAAIGDHASGFKKSRPDGASSGRLFEERSWFVFSFLLKGKDAHLSFRSIHRGRSRPGWRSRPLWGGQLIPDAWASLPNASGLSRDFCAYDVHYAV